MTKQTIKELATIATVIAAIFGAPKLTQNSEDELLSSMHEEITILSSKIDDLKRSDSVISVSYAHVISSVDSLVIRARVEDGIRKAMSNSMNRNTHKRSNEYASKED